MKTLGLLPCRPTMSAGVASAGALRSSDPVLGPSAAVKTEDWVITEPHHATAAAAGSTVWKPRAVVVALAEYCAAHALPQGEVGLHLYAFGTARAAGELAASLEDGAWP